MVRTASQSAGFMTSRVVSIGNSHPFPRSPSPSVPPRGFVANGDSDRRYGNAHPSGSVFRHGLGGAILRNGGKTSRTNPSPGNGKLRAAGKGLVGRVAHKPEARAKVLPSLALQACVRSPLVVRFRINSRVGKSPVFGTVTGLRMRRIRF